MDIMPFGRAQSFRNIRSLLNVIPDMCICAVERSLTEAKDYGRHKWARGRWNLFGFWEISLKL